MNILEQEDLIKGLDDRRLQEEAKRPTGQVPQFLVVSEIQRRTDMRKKYQDPSQQQPQGTIADQITQAGIASVRPPQMMQGQPMPMQAYGGGMTPFMRKYAGGGVVQMQSGRRIMRPDITADGYVPANTSYLEEIERRRLEEEAARQFSNALIEDSESANLYSATSGDPTDEGYVNPVSIDLARQVRNYASDDNVVDYTRSENPQYRPPNSNLNPDGTIKESFASEEEAETERGLGGLLDRGEDSAKGLLRSVFAAGDKLPSGREVGDFLNSKNLPSFYDVGQFVGPQVSQINRVLNVPYDAAYNAIAPVTEGIQNIYRGMTGQDSVDKGFRYPSLSDKFSSAASAFAGDDPVEANINATPQTGPAVIEPKVDAEVSGDAVVKSAEETIKRARDKSSQSDIDANVKQNRITSGASGLGNLFGLEGDKKQAFSMALMALGAGIAKGDTAGGLKDAGLAMNAINEQSLDREDKRLDRIGEAEDRALRRLDLEDSSAARKQRTQETASYRLQTLMDSYLKDRGSVDTPEQQIEYENKLRKALGLPVLELNTGADVGLTGGNLSSSAGGNMSYSKETGLKK
jgi:hypothetical protein